MVHFLHFYMIVTVCYAGEAILWRAMCYLEKEDNSPKVVTKLYLKSLMEYCKAFVWPYFLWKEHFNGRKDNMV